MEQLYISRFKKLAEYLLSLPEDYKHFDMGEYIKAEDTYTQYRSVVDFPNECKTVGCALGHTVYAGIEGFNIENYVVCLARPPFTPIRISWTKIIHEFFDEDIFSSRGRWMFSSDWSDIDNTARGAAIRILYLLDKLDDQNNYDISDLYYNIHIHGEIEEYTNIIENFKN